MIYLHTNSALKFDYEKCSKIIEGVEFPGGHSHNNGKKSSQLLSPSYSVIAACYVGEGISSWIHSGISLNIFGMNLDLFDFFKSLVHDHRIKLGNRIPFRTLLVLTFPHRVILSFQYPDVKPFCILRPL